MEHSEKSAAMHDFEVGNGDYASGDVSDLKKSSAADKRDMARMNKDQELRVRDSAKRQASHELH